MKTYLYACMFIACFAMGCSEEGVGDKIDESPSLLADYTVLVQKDGVLKTALLNADSDGITVNSAQSDFEVVPMPDLSYRHGSKLGFYIPQVDCSAKISIHDFSEDTVVHTTVFTEDLNCDRDVKSIAFSGNKALVAYVIPSETKKDNYFLRILDLTKSPSSFTDVVLSKEPKQLLVSDNKVFLLSLDTDITNKYALTALNMDSGAVTHEVILGDDVLKISKDGMGNILVSYPNLHSIIDGNTMILGITTNYLLGKEPKFGYAKSEYFGEQTIYYPMASGSKSSYPNIAAVYDFKENMSVLYIYENFLSPEQRDLKYEIEDTTMVSYDAKNNLILIGYKKKGGSGKGGLMRIKPIPDPKFLDNVDLDGIPMELFSN
ncbi:hypothetical protein [Arenibacter sp. F20364]|uniref:hypothetical protein n=1 Tax=Arenibacter sp. F20364 TaxID=2926415 RepID=UPI001FF375E7|nr:hypothetical protein [Arenibacter sp. F20364]MCK0192793.1 hypothetical protein [Arenibacter sp. F20364]